jgi:hypothetical protein
MNSGGEKINTVKDYAGQDTEREKQIKKLHDGNLKAIELRKDYYIKKIGTSYLNFEPIDKRYSDKGVKRWYEYPRSVRIGNKYLSVEDALIRNLYYVKNKLHIENKVKDHMLQYVADPRSAMEDWIQSVMMTENITNSIFHAVKYYTAADNLVFGTALVDTLGYSEDLVYDFWKKLTGKGDNIYFNGCCEKWKCIFRNSDSSFNDPLPHKEYTIAGVIWHVIDEYENALTISVSDDKNEMHNISIKDAMIKMLEKSAILEPFSEEKKRYDMNKAYLEFVTTLVSKKLFDYLESLNINKLEKMEDSCNQIFTYIPKELLCVSNMEKEHDVTEIFLNKVIAPYFSTDRFFWDLKKNPGRYHLSSWDEDNLGHSYWDDEKHAKQLCKMIDEEDPLAKYEFSPVLKKRILDSGYDGVGMERYAEVMLGDFNPKYFLKSFVKKPKFTDNEKYMLGKYADQNYALSVVR